MYLETACADLLRGKEEEESVFPSLPPRYTPRYRYARGESGLQKERKRRENMAIGVLS